MHMVFKSSYHIVIVVAMFSSGTHVQFVWPRRPAELYDHDDA